MELPVTPNGSDLDLGRSADKPRAFRVLNVWVLAGTAIALAVVGIAAHFWRGHQVRRAAPALAERAEALAGEKDYPAAAAYYVRYLALCPDDATARLRRAELVDLATAGQGGLRTVELLQEALRPSNQRFALAPDRELAARRRLAELLLQTQQIAAAESEIEKLCELEKKELSQEPGEWRWAGLKALALIAKHRGEHSVDPRITLENKEIDDAFLEVLEPEKVGKPKVYRDPKVYLARYMYRVGNLPNANDPKESEAYQKAMQAAKQDLEAAVALAPNDATVLLTAAASAQSEGLNAAQAGNPNKAREAYSIADSSCERAIAAVPSEPSAYLFFGRLYKSRGEMSHAIQIWRRGLNEVKTEDKCIQLNLDLAEVLIAQNRLVEAELALKNIDNVIGKVEPNSRLSLQHLVDLQRAKLLLLRGRYEEAISLVAGWAVGNETEARIYEALNILGDSHAALARTLRDGSKTALTHWESAAKAYEEAAGREPGEIGPRLKAAVAWGAAADVCENIAHDSKIADAGHQAAADKAALLDKATVSCQDALNILNASRHPPERQKQAIYDVLIALLEKQNKNDKANDYKALRIEQMADSPQLTLLGVERAIRDAKYEDALEVAERCVQGHPKDALAYFSLGRAERAKKNDRQAADAYNKAFETASGAPAVQMQLVEYLLQAGNSSDAAEAEKVLGNLLPRYAPACLRLIAILDQRGKTDEAVTVAQKGVQCQPKDPIAHVALATAWMGKKETAKAESEYQAAVQLAPEAPAPALALLSFYAGTGREKLAREQFEQMLRKAKLPAIDLELVRADGLARLGDHQDAKDAYRKAVEISREDPAVQMRLAEFLLNSRQPAEEVEGERVLHSIMLQYDPARRRLAEVLIARGGEQEWEEAQKLMEQSAGDQSSIAVDRFVQAVSLVRRGGSENLAKAAEVCTALLDRMPSVRLLLARIRDLQNKVDDARNQYRMLVKQEHPATIQLAAYVDFLLRRGPAIEADQPLQQLAKQLPEDLVVAELRARWLRDQHRDSEIEPYVDGIAAKLVARIKDNPRQEAQLSRTVGDLYARVEKHAAAEGWYRRLLKLEPNSYDRLAISLARQGRMHEVIALCKEVGNTDSSARPALVLTSALISGIASAEDLASVEPFLNNALDAHKEQTTLLAAMADIRVRQERYNEAIELYRQILAQQPKNVGALNNLATLLSEQSESKNRNEALAFIQRAIEQVGPQPGLLDTKGMTLFFSGKPDQALTALEEAIQAPILDPRWQFHLAVVCGQLGELERARAALKLARSGNLDRQLLTKVDRRLLADLEKKLGL
jgi:tetratricopeptide (TPR) repeat protein